MVDERKHGPFYEEKPVRWIAESMKKIWMYNGESVFFLFILMLFFLSITVSSTSSHAQYPSHLPETPQRALRSY